MSYPSTVGGKLCVGPGPSSLVAGWGRRLGKGPLDLRIALSLGRGFGGFVLWSGSVFWLVPFVGSCPDWFEFVGAGFNWSTPLLV